MGALFNPEFAKAIPPQGDCCEMRSAQVRAAGALFNIVLFRKMRVMKTIRLYRNPQCERCARYARMHHRLDWLNRFEDTTEIGPGGPLRLGEIAVQDLRTGVMLKGIDCFRLLCKNIPAYWLALPFTYLPAVRKKIENDIGGCLDGVCEAPASKRT